MIFVCMAGPFEILAQCIGSSHLRNNCCCDVSYTGGGVLSNKVAPKASCEIAKVNKLCHGRSCNMEQKWTTQNHSMGPVKFRGTGYHEGCIRFLKSLLVFSLVSTLVVP